MAHFSFFSLSTVRSTNTWRELPSSSTTRCPAAAVQSNVPHQWLSWGSWQFAASSCGEVQSPWDEWSCTPIGRDDRRIFLFFNFCKIFIAKQQTKHDKRKEPRPANKNPLTIMPTNPLAKFPWICHSSRCCYFSLLSVFSCWSLFLVHILCKTMTSTSGIDPCCLYFGETRSVRTAAMGCLGDLRLLMTNSGQAGAVES